VSSRLRAQFQPAELSSVLARYDLGAIHRVDQQLKGSRRSPKVRVISDKGEFLMKRRAAGRDHPMKVALAHTIQQYLMEHQFPLPRLVTARDGDDTMVIMDDQIYELFEYVTGDHYDRSTRATADGGRVLGLFHRLLKSFDSEWEPSRRGYHDVAMVRNHLSEIPAAIGNDDSVVGKESELLSTVSTLSESYESAAEIVNDAGYSEWPSQIVHADWHPGNMLFLKGKVVAVIDYDSIRLLPRVTDLANGALQFSILGGPVDPREWPAELDEDRLRHFLMGYERGASAPTDVMAVLPWLMIEALIAEAVMPIAATGSFGRLEGFRFLQMILRKVRFLEQNGSRLMTMLQV
jgi:Ser/Thr protein kinase RdoA (MazF antagonist)